MEHSWGFSPASEIEGQIIWSVYVFKVYSSDSVVESVLRDIICLFKLKCVGKVPPITELLRRHIGGVESAGKILNERKTYSVFF